MRLATVEVNGRALVVGSLGDGRLVDVAGMVERHVLGPVGFPKDMVDLIRAGASGRELLKRVEEVARKDQSNQDLFHREDAVKWLAPIPCPRQMPYVFANQPDTPDFYIDRANPNSGGRWPRPLYFLKTPSSIIGAGETIELYEDMYLVTPEAELCAVIGRKAKHVRTEDAMGVIWGFTLANDVTSGGLSQQDGVAFTNAKDGKVTEQFFSRPMARYKGADTFGPLGPFITLKDEIGPLEELTISARFNGEVVEHGGIADYKYSIAEVIATITEVITLDVGDVVSMGTVPAVPGKTIRSANLLQGGVIEIDSPQIGVLRNPIKVNPPLWPDYPKPAAPKPR